MLTGSQFALWLTLNEHPAKENISKMSTGCDKNGKQKTAVQLKKLQHFVSYPVDILDMFSFAGCQQGVTRMESRRQQFS